MLDLIAQEIDLPTELTAAGFLASLFGLIVWWVIWVLKPQYQARAARQLAEEERRFNQEIRESEKRIAREDEQAAKQNHVYEVLAVTVPAIHETLAEFHKANENHHLIMQDKLDKLLADRRDP